VDSLKSDWVQSGFQGIQRLWLARRKLAERDELLEGARESLEALPAEELTAIFEVKGSRKGLSLWLPVPGSTAKKERKKKTKIIDSPSLCSLFRFC
jgi:hypothetical protein